MKKTFYFGALMGLFGSFAVYISINLGWPAWVLFLAWICFYLYGKSMKKSSNIYLQIVLGILLSVSIELSGEFLSQYIGVMGHYVSIFLLVGSLAFLIKIRQLRDLTAWFFGFIVFFGTEPEIALSPILKNLLLPLAAGFLLAFVVDFIVVKYIHNEAPASH